MDGSCQLHAAKGTQDSDFLLASLKHQPEELMEKVTEASPDCQKSAKAWTSAEKAGVPKKMGMSVFLGAPPKKKMSVVFGCPCFPAESLGVSSQIRSFQRGLRGSFKGVGPLFDELSLGGVASFRRRNRVPCPNPEVPQK